MAEKVVLEPRGGVDLERLVLLALLNPLAGLVLLPFLPAIVGLLVVQASRRRITVTEIRRTSEGWLVIEYER